MHFSFLGYIICHGYCGSTMGLIMGTLCCTSMALTISENDLVTMVTKLKTIIVQG
jgi:hypothetical protein